jgi:hypothetical protein
MGTNFNNTTPAAPANNVNVSWQTDGNGNVSAYVAAGVTSVNSQTGAVEVEGGAGITISSGSGVITVGLTGGGDVTSINGQGGAIEIVGSQGIIVSTSSGTITISGIGGVLKETGSYGTSAADTGYLISFNDSSAATLTLPSSAPASGWNIRVKNINTGVITVSRNGLNIDGAASNLTLTQGDGVSIWSDGTNYFTGEPRPISVVVMMPGVGSNAQVLAYFKMDRPCVFPASAPNSFGVANTAATGSTTFTFKKNGSSFATAVFSSSGTTATFTQASAASFAIGDIFEVDGPATADATLANMGLTLQGYRL